MAKFVAKLRRLTRDCEFKEHLDEASQDRFVGGLQNEATQKRLLAEPNFMFHKAIDIAQTMKTAAKNTHQIKGVELQVAQSGSSRKNHYQCGKDGHFQKIQTTSIVTCIYFNYTVWREIFVGEYFREFCG